MRLEYFQLIDRIAALNLEDRTITVEAQVPTASTIFEGHFPGYPLMPGVLLIESMAQTCGWLIIARSHFERMPFLASVKDAKLRQFVRPGETLAIDAVIEHEGSGYSVVKAKVREGGKVVCDATLAFRVTEFPNEKFRDQMRLSAEKLSLPSLVTPNG